MLLNLHFQAAIYYKELSALFVPKKGHVPAVRAEGDITAGFIIIELIAAMFNHVTTSYYRSLTYAIRQPFAIRAKHQVANRPAEFLSRDAVHNHR